MNWLNLPAALPTIGTASGLLIIIVILTRLWLTSEGRASREITRINTAHDLELNELRAELQQCRQYANDLNTRLDDERERRRRAEDEARTTNPGAGAQ